MNESLDIQRARHAWEQATSINNVTSDFLGAAKKLPMMIRTCGLAQSLAFFEAKESNKEVRLACEKWLRKVDVLPRPAARQAAQQAVRPVLQQANRQPLRQAAPQTAALSLCETLISSESTPDHLRRCTSETMAYLNWLIRFLEAKKTD